MHNDILFIVSFTIKEAPFTLLYPNILKTLFNLLYLLSKWSKPNNAFAVCWICYTKNCFI